MTELVRKVSLEVTVGQKASMGILLGTESHFGDLLDRRVLEEYGYTKISPRISRAVVAHKNIGVEIAGIVGGISYNADVIRPSEAPEDHL
jgi:hypothetical protein